MTDPHEPETAPSDELQFDNAEFTATPPGMLTCAACAREVNGTYYEVNGKVICEPCRETILAHQSGGSGLVRFVRAFFFGGLAAFVGFMIYFGVAKVTGWEIGLIAVLVGFLVGSAVRAGSRHRGGWLYQLLAVFLTYTAVVATYSSFAIPAFVADLEARKDAKDAEAEALLAQAEKKAKPKEGLEARPGDPAPDPDKANDTPKQIGDEDTGNSAPKDGMPVKEANAEVKPADGDEPGKAATAAVAQADKNPPRDAEAPAGAEKPEPAGRAARPENLTPLMVILALAAFGVLYSIPILIGIQSPISLIIIGFALWEAWKLNRRVAIVFNGPYDVGGGHAHPASEHEDHA